MGAVAVVTLYRQAITLPVFARDDEDEAPRDTFAERAAIMAEIAERLDELEALKKGAAADVITQLALIAGTSRRTFEITIHLLHGDYSEVLASYQDQGGKRGKTKQDIHYEFQQEVARVAKLWPELGRCIMGIRAQATQHEDPIARNEVACAHGPGE